MAVVGLLANPASSKDIRRVVTYATTVTNHEKVSIVRRILLGLAATPVTTVRYMPDQANLAVQAAQRLELPFAFEPIEQPILGTVADTMAAAAALAAEAACLITLGGDGTARAALKAAPSLPILALSTGTNNAFPLLIEPTLAGMAAGAFATVAPDAANPAPLLVIERDGVAVDVALIDVAAVADTLGGRAVWEMERVRAVVTTRLTPGTVGLSALGGHLGDEPPAAAQAVGLALGPGRICHAPVAPGVIAPVPIAAHEWLGDNATYELPAETVLALDGERELKCRPGERWTVRVQASAIRVVDVPRALAALATADAYA